MPTPFAFTNTPTSPTPPDPKLHLTTGALPRYITPSQPPHTKPPFAQIHAVPFVASTTLLLPTELHTLLRPHLTTALLTPDHARLHLTLTDLLTPPLLTHIQTPGTHVSLLCVESNTPGVDDACFFLRPDGVLRLELSRERYERAGLPNGRSVKAGGRKHVRERFVVEFDLRSAAMREGKKGFERLRLAAREVFGGRRAWLGVVRGGAGREVFEGLAPEWRGGVALERGDGAWKVPVGLLTGREGLADEEDAWALVEWADLVALGSSRVMDGDLVDEFVSRYEVPGDADGATVVGGVTVLRWAGLLSNRWVLDLLMELARVSRIQRSGMQQWAVLSVAGHQTEAVGNVDGYLIFLQPGQDDGGSTAETMEAEAETSKAAVAMQEGNGIVEDGQKEDEMDLDLGGSTAGTLRAGFQRFICMQFVDSMQL